MPWVNGTLTDTTAGEEFTSFNLETPGTAVYGKLLSRIKEHVCGYCTVPTRGGGLTGAATEGFIRGLEPTVNTTAKTWTLTFSSSTVFAITASGETTVNGTLVGGVATVSAARFICRVYEGSVPFSSGNMFTFNTVPSPLGLQTWDIISDTAKGSGSYCGNDDSTAANLSDYGNLVSVVNNSATATKGVLESLRFYDQSAINQLYYVTFSSASAFSLRNSAGTVLASGTVGTPFSYGVAGAYISFTIQAGSTAFTATTGTYPSYTGDFFTITPRSSVGANTHLTRIIVLRSRGLAGEDQIYYTFSQRSGGNGGRFFLEVAIHPSHNPALGTFSQPYMSDRKRIRHSQLPSGAVPYYIIASGRHIYVLTTPATNDHQVLGAGFLLPHARPTAEDQTWPGFVGGTYTAVGLLSGAGEVIPNVPSGPFFNGGGTAGTPPVSTLSVVLPGALITWGYGANHIGSTIYGAGSSAGIATSLTAGACYTHPYHLIGSSAGYSRIDSGVFGEVATRKAIFPVAVLTNGPDVGGVIGEFPGLFFIGYSTQNPVNVGDTLNSGTHVIWKGCNNTISASVDNTAAFALE